MKIRLEYEVPEGRYCSIMCDNSNTFYPCKCLMHSGYCSIFGTKPISDSYGHMVLLSKLHVCVDAAVDQNKDAGTKAEILPT